MTKEDIDLVRLALSVYHTRTVYPGCVEAFDRIVQEVEMPTPMTIEMEEEDTWLREKIGIALGESSMCWSEIPTGVFHSERATEILNDLCYQINTRKSPQVPVIKILETVLEQAEDDGLWFNAKYASEAYLQQELRRLHAAVERAYAELQKGD